MTKSTYYVTTPIYYPSGRLHIGNTYSTLLADAMARYKRLMDYEVFFLTGTDEHGQKIERTAHDLGQDPQDYVDHMAASIKQLWQELDITNDYFIRTTDQNHKEAVQAIFEQLLAQDDIYLGEYTGWYSVSDEEYFTESQLTEVYRNDQGEVIGGVAPSGHEVELVNEESYFFRLSKYADRLLDYFNNHPDFLVPASRKHEMINNFIKPGLSDFAITRTTFSWGIPIPSDPKHVVYVWIDALSNYITALGYGSPQDELFDKFWPADLQIIGKDISRFHMLYWPAILMALDLPLPKQIFAHGWIVMKDGKMSKSLGNTIYPETLIERYGLDATRFYLLSVMSQANDSVFTPEDFVNVVNTRLANDLGNLLNRTVAMINQYFQGEIDPSQVGDKTDLDRELADFIQRHVQDFHTKMDELQVAQAIDQAMAIVSRTNKYIDETTPWTLAKEDDQAPRLQGVLLNLVDALRVIAHLLRPFMPQAPLDIFQQLGLGQEADRLLKDVQVDQVDQTFQVVAKGQPIFPRLEVELEVTHIHDAMQAQIQAAQATGGVDDPSWDPEDQDLSYDETPAIDFDHFMATELKVAQVVDVAPVQGSNKLLRFRLDAGDPVHRQVLSGIAQDYPDYEELIGQKVCLVANLKPRKMMGAISQGMILSTETPEGLKLVFADPQAPNGSRLS